jgi:hypothetical protein
MNDLEDVLRSMYYTQQKLEYLKKEIPRLSRQVFQIKRFQLIEQLDEIRVRQIMEIPYDVHYNVSAIIHEIRSCLDRFACVLAVRNGQNTRDVYFPVVNKVADLTQPNERQAKRLTKFKSEDLQSLIKLEVTNEEDPIIYGMHRADINWKHVKINGMLGTGISNVGNGAIVIDGSGKFYNNSINGVSTGKLEIDNPSFEGINIGWKTIARNLPRNLDVHIEIDLKFTEPDDLKGWPILTSIDRFHKKVDQIVQKFNF